MKLKRGMTNLDVIVKAVSQVTGQPEQRFRQTICASIEKGDLPPGKLFEKCPNGSEKVRDLVQNEGEAILVWAVQGAVMAHRQVPENAA